MAPSTPSTPVSKSGITTDAVTGERHIPSSTRADGSKRREIRVRPGYRPPEDVEVYKNRTAAAFKARGTGGIPGVEGLKDDKDSAGTASSNKNAKRREARKKAKAESETATETTDNTPPSPSANTKSAQIASQENWRATDNKKPTEEDKPEPVDPAAENEKKARNLKKKLRQARELREKKDKGENLLPEQFEKVIKIQELIRQLDSLGFDSNGEKKES
ncbi:hypothetical protein FQN54_007827 [Arachnomyces sp. PD_36]|nr:hypothetical protein FQN54_007827 [Arachnomyces sp. PD_36]